MRHPEVLFIAVECIGTRMVPAVNSLLALVLVFQRQRPDCSMCAF